MKITKDLRRYTAPARGSVAWKKRFKKRTAVERVNAYLKEFFQLDNVRYRSGERAKVHGDMVTLIYNASKLAADRIGALWIDQQAAYFCFLKYNTQHSGRFCILKRAIMKLTQLPSIF